MNEVKKVFTYGQTCFEVHLHLPKPQDYCASAGCSVIQCNITLGLYRIAATNQLAWHVHISAAKHVLCLQVVSGGLCCQSGVTIAELGDKNDDMLIAVAAVTVGY